MKAALVALVLTATAALASEPPRVYIAPAEAAAGSSSKDKARHIDFGPAIAAALLKKAVPVVVVTDPSRAQWTIKSQASQKEDSTGIKIAKLAFGGGDDDSSTVEATVQVIDNETTAVRYAYNVKKDDVQSAAEAFAKHFKDDYLKKQQ